VWPAPILHRRKGSGAWSQSNLSPRNLISHVNSVMMSVTAIPEVTLVTFLHPHFNFYCDSRHFLFSTLITLQVCALLEFQFWIFPLSTSGIMWLNTVLWLVRTPQCGVTNCSVAMSQTLSFGAEEGLAMGNCVYISCHVHTFVCPLCKELTSVTMHFTRWVEGSKDLVHFYTRIFVDLTNIGTYISNCVIIDGWYV